jgi:hypothetical protein
MVGFCERGNELLVSIKFLEFLEQLSWFPFTEPLLSDKHVQAVCNCVSKQDISYLVFNGLNVLLNFFNYITRGNGKGRKE